MELIENSTEPTLLQKGEALNLQFQLFSDLTLIRMLIEPIREASSSLPSIEIPAFQQLFDSTPIISTLQHQIDALAALETTLLSTLQITSDDQIYTSLAPYQRQTDLKIIQQPLQTQVTYMLLNTPKLLKRSQQNTQNQEILATGTATPSTDVAGNRIFTKQKSIIKEHFGVFQDGIFFANLLKMSSAQSGNLDEIKKLQGLVLQKRRSQKSYEVKSKNRSIDTETVYKKIIGFVERKSTGNDQDMIQVIKNGIFNK